MASCSGAPVGFAYEVPPAVAVAVRPPSGVAVQATVPGVRVAETSTKPASFAGRVKVSRNTTPGTVAVPSLRYDITYWLATPARPTLPVTMFFAVVRTLASRSMRTQSLAWLLAPLISPTESGTAGSTATPAVLQNAPVAGAPAPQLPGLWPMLSNSGRATVMTMSADAPGLRAVAPERQTIDAPVTGQVQPAGALTVMPVLGSPLDAGTKPGSVSFTTMPVAGTASVIARLVTRRV